MKHVALIFTGGTISMKLDAKSHGVIPSLTPNEILHALSGLDEFDNLLIHEFSRKPSPSITLEDMSQIGLIAQNYLNRNDVAGVVVIHGTDTLEETAFYLHCVIQSDKPVVVTGSMKNASEFGYDGVTNLVSSIKVCLSKDSQGKGTLVVMNDTINSALEVTKTHTMSLDTFKSIEFGPLGIIDQGDVIYYRNVAHYREYHLMNKINHDTHLIKAYAGMTSEFIDYLVKNGARGIVIEALGRGNLPPSMLPSIDNAINKNVVIVLVSRCYAGRVLDTYAYEGGGKDLANRGCLLGGNLTGQQARILLMLAISNNLSKKKIKSLFSL